MANDRSIAQNARASGIRRALLSPLVPVLLLAPTMPLWLERSALSSIRATIMETTPLQYRNNDTVRDIRDMAVVSQPVDLAALAVTASPEVSRPNQTVDVQRPAVNVLYGLSGNNKNFLAEFEVSLKSVLLNAPINMNLNVHVLADKAAYQGISGIFQRAKLKDSVWGTQITIYTYDVTPHVEKWKKVVSKLYQKRIGRVTRHTIGAYFRLFANQVVPESVTHVVYMDTDVVVMSNLADLWTRFDRNATYSWGRDHCSGFVVFNVKKLPTIWKMAEDFNFAKYASGDQLILKQVQKMYPKVVRHLPQEWAISVANGGLWRHAKKILDYRPKVAMLHFNGQGARAVSWWQNKKGYAYKYPKTFGNALYYVNLPWRWARFNGESLAAGREPYKLVIHHDKFNGKTTSNTKAVTTNPVTKKQKINTKGNGASNFTKVNETIS